MIGSNKPLGVDKRKLAVCVDFLKYCAVIFFLFWLDILTPIGLTILYLSGGLVFSVVLCFEPYYSSLPKQLTEELFRKRPGFGYRDKWIISTTLKQYQLDGKHYVSFYWLPYNQAYVTLLRWKWLRLKTLNASYNNRFWSVWVVLVGLRYYKANATIEQVETVRNFGSNPSLGEKLMTSLIWESNGVNQKQHPDLKEFASELVHFYREESICIED